MDLAVLPLDLSVVATRSRVTTATLTTVLSKRGLRNVWLRGALLLQSERPRGIGRAFTLRFVPAREDLATPANTEPRDRHARARAQPS